MVGFLRTIGIINAAIWFGSVVFFTIGVGPAFFSEDMTKLIPQPYNGVAAQVVLKRYFYLQIWCAGVALAQLSAEWLYSRRPIHRFTLLLLMCLFLFGILGGYVFLPKMKELHVRMYHPQTTAEVKASSKRSFGILHGTASVMNLLVIAGVLVYLYQVTKPAANGARFTSMTRFRT